MNLAVFGNIVTSFSWFGVNMLGIGLPTTVSLISCNPTSLNSGGTSSCTVTLSQAAGTGGITVTLSSNAAALTVPASVTVTSGATSANFTATAVPSRPVRRRW